MITLHAPSASGRRHSPACSQQSLSLLSPPRLHPHEMPSASVSLLGTLVPSEQRGEISETIAWNSKMEDLRNSGVCVHVCAHTHTHTHSVTQSCLTLWNPPGSYVHGIFQQEYWSRLPLPPPGDLPNPGIKPTSLSSSALAGGFFTQVLHLVNPGETLRWVLLSAAQILLVILLSGYPTLPSTLWDTLLPSNK